MKKKITMGKPKSKRLSPEPADSLEANIVRMALNGELAKISQRAVQKQIDLGLPVTFSRGRDIVKRYADGREEILGHIKPIKYRAPKGVEILGKQ